MSTHPTRRIEVFNSVELVDSYWPADVSVDLADLTVGGMLLGAADDGPTRTALIEGIANPHRRSWSYAQLAEAAVGGAHELLDEFSPGERIAAWAPNMPEWEILQFASALAGLTLVTVNPSYREEELEHVLRHSGAVGVVSVEEHRGNEMRRTLSQIEHRLPDLRRVIDLQQWQPSPRALSAVAALPEVEPGDPVMIQYTSGTTGKPKGVLLSHRGVVNTARLFARRFGIEPGSIWLDPLPMFHVGGCVLAAMGSMWGRSAHVPFSFQAGLALHLVEQERAQAMPAVPTMFLAMMEHADFSRTDLSSLETVISGSTPVPTEVVKRVERAFGVRYGGTLFGLTEASGAVCQPHAGDSIEDKVETVGPPLERTELKVANAEGKPLPCGQTGEIWIRGFGVMLGYLDAPDETAKAIDSQGWLRTGDLGEMDSRGYVRITGRIKEMIIRGGENLYPREIEDRIIEHPDVADVAVIGIPDAHWGEEVVAFVRPMPQTSPTVESLAAALVGRLAPNKIPRHWRLVESMPTTASGKIQKFVLRESFTPSSG